MTTSATAKHSSPSRNKKRSIGSFAKVLSIFVLQSSCEKEVTMAADLLGIAFIPYYNHLMNLLKTNPELRKTAKGIFKQVAWAAGCTAVGGIVGGPVGAMAGGLVGSFLGYRLSSDYDSLITVLQELTDDEKADLVKKVQELVGSTTIEALTRFIGCQVQRENLLNLLRSAAQDLKGG
ncbi:uncharacterized protein LOC112564176 [Pomacea canaliculata]|uniref:uncharacterized protein LOC112564176 n=1 Tax=Pomacea canaliculata TaxID=400727 RepID=UPI000D72981F|nr:uncharacterized protein LOC112564176 [Pomacea canaliculata]